MKRAVDFIAALLGLASASAKIVLWLVGSICQQQSCLAKISPSISFGPSSTPHLANNIYIRVYGTLAQHFGIVLV